MVKKQKNILNIKHDVQERKFQNRVTLQCCCDSTLDRCHRGLTSGLISLYYPLRMCATVYAQHLLGQVK